MVASYTKDLTNHRTVKIGGVGPCLWVGACIGQYSRIYILLAVKLGPLQVVNVNMKFWSVFSGLKIFEMRASNFDNIIMLMYIYRY